MNDRKAIMLNRREVRAIMESLVTLRKNRPGNLDADEVDELCERIKGKGKTSVDFPRTPVYKTACDTRE